MIPISDLSTTKTKLVIVEGIPGSGKSTLSGYLHDSLHMHHIKSELFLEGNLRHPADYESVACIPNHELDQLRSIYSDSFHYIEPFITLNDNDSLVSYALAQQSFPNGIPSRLYEDIQRYEIYDGVSVDKYCELMVERWKSFGKEQGEKEDIVILECCFLQNPGCALLARHDAGNDRFIQHILKTAEQIQELNPILFYLDQSNVRQTIDRVKDKRSQEWLDFVIWYHTEQDYGKNKRLHGYEGYIKFLEQRRELELQIIEQLPIQSFIIDNSDYDWENQQQTVTDLIMKYL